MTIPEEIEQLKIKLAQTADEHDQAAILLDILDKYGEIPNTESEPYVDQLLLLAEKKTELRYKAWGLYYLTNIKYVKGEYDVSLDLCHQALSVFDKIKEVKGIFSCYNNIGVIYEKQGNYPAALRNYFASLKLMDDKYSIAACYNNIGAVYHHQGNYPEALKNFFASLKVREEIGDKSGIAQSYLNIGVVYDKQGNYPAALKNHLASLKLSEEAGDKSSIADSYLNIGAVYGNLGNYPEAQKNNFASLKLYDEIGDKFRIASAYCYIGIVYYRLGNYPEALKNQSASLKLSEEIGDKYSIAASNNSIGVVHYNQGNYAEALKNYFAALNLAEEIDAPHITESCSLGLFNAYKAVHDFENALKYHEKYHQIDSKILGEQTQKQLTNLSFIHNLEQKEKDLEIEQLRNVELKKERDRSESLLLNILPGEVAEELKDKGTAGAKLFAEVTVLFTDFKSFTTVSERLTPQQLVDELHACFSAFDEIMAKHNIEKIKTVGDAYLAVSGLPLANTNHATDVINAAIEIRAFMKERRKIRGASTFEIRIGAHSGSVVAGIVGIKKFAYDIWGDTVNTAARMEQNSEAGKINISEITYELVKDKFNCEYRGEIEAKNKGFLKMYFVG